MFQDTKQELDRLQAALMEEEDEPLDAREKAVLRQQLRQLQGKAAAEEEQPQPVRGIGGLVTAAVVLTLAIAAVVLWWLWRIL